MAKQCMIERNKRRIKKTEQYRQRRAKLKAVLMSLDADLEAKAAAMAALEKMPRDSSPTRVRNRCIETGRPRGNYKRFNLSRIKLLEYFYLGLIPGLRKSSW